MNKANFDKHSTPCLTTALAGPLQTLEQKILANRITIETWLREQWQQTPPPFYCSVDIRNSGFQIAPVDSNLYPAGFNNLHPNLLPLAIQATATTLDRLTPKCKRLLIIPESHTRNPFYFENVAVLQEILLAAGYETRIGTLIPELHQAKTITLNKNKKLLLEPITKKGNRIYLNEFDPCIIILNNDFSDGIPKLLSDIEQPIMPPLELTWAHRRKSQHFHFYQLVANQFAKLIDIDPWHICPMFQLCEKVNFMNGEGLTCLTEHIVTLLEKINQKYQALNIDRKPYVIIKPDTGTYGLGIMTVTNANQIQQLNRKQRQQMSTIKGGQPVTRVLIQEGIYTSETIGKQNAVAEPVVYMIGQHVVGGFYRVHNQRGPDENLNSPGMEFHALAFDCSCNMPDLSDNPDCQLNRFYTYGVIARLALLATAQEIRELTS